MFTEGKSYSSVLKDRPNRYACAVIRTVCRHFNKGGQSN